LAGVLAAGTGLSVVPWLRRIPLPNWAAPLSAVGVVTLASLAGFLLHVVYAAGRRPDTARRLGVLADIASFWPRETHPTVPPCYGLKVVPEVADRVAEHLAEPGTRVVLVGHSQGSLLAALAMARLLESIPEPDRERVGLVTTGAQLQWAYPRAFPSVVAHASLAELAGQLRGRWRALCRGTDALGGAVTTWHRQVFGDVLLGVGFRDDGTVGPLAPATRGTTGVLVLGGDHWLPDPQPGPLPGRRWSPGVRGHSDYLSEPEWDRAIAIAAGLEPVASERPVATNAAETNSGVGYP
jgi:pimeloyl-ACP methyl ester carboxylesterase